MVSTYFGNIAFAYEDYGLPYCFSASLFNTGIDKPNGYDEGTMEDINEGGRLTKTTTGLADGAVSYTHLKIPEAVDFPGKFLYTKIIADPHPLSGGAFF